MGRRASAGGICPGTPSVRYPPAQRCPRWRRPEQSGYADAWLKASPSLSQATQRANDDRAGQIPGAGTAVARTFGSDEYEFYFQDSWQILPSLTITGGVRYSLYSPPFEVNGLQVAPAISMGAMVRRARAQHAARDSLAPKPHRHLRPRRPGERSPRLLRVGQEQHRAALAAAWSPTGERDCCNG